ncbi:MAG: large conductance mechanosensitive channel protein MscL [Acetobacteraceae bacterium]|nr:large conductance mechanosensitive channel protein MscL [Acetobacteraceae bacterium]
MQPSMPHLPPQPAWVKEFKAFIMRGNVIDLAVGIIIGAAFTAIVGSLVTDIFNPLLGLLMGGIDFSNLFIVLAGERGPTLEATRESGAAVIAIGLFINACINFIIVGFAIFWLIKVLSRFKEKQAEAPPPEPAKSEVLLEEIRDLLKSRAP